MQGTQRLCVAPGGTQSLKLSGTIYGSWTSTGDAVIEFWSLEYRYIDIGQGQGYFELYGCFKDSNLVMDDRNSTDGKFRSGLQIEHASITLTPASFSPPHVP